VAPNTAAWDISFFADAGGQPGVLIKGYIFFASSITATPVGIGIFSGDEVPVFDFHVGGSPSFGFDAKAGETYWISILSETITTFNPLFSWTGSDSGGSSVQDVRPSGFRTVQPDNRALTLEGTVPGPAALVLLGLGLAAVAARARCRS
jgi:hypothetical protein